ncbi:MAG TPA: type II toxin-antitoxin system HicB family antitoxin [Bryobacteraceae bacterium]|nr:type II toxin-antitoxin system HicB family antitoxin [Bryobacteraceae bacterium]HPT27607.1 type II toxin-antitoxin system HicB family antitoxin [Bryobacteraceae bacterium]
MSESKYPVFIHWSDEDRVFIAEAPDLPGCMADGATRAEAVNAIEIVIAEWIETANSIGRPVPKASRHR